MKRIHIHIAVNQLPESIGFYSTIFGTSPSIEHQDYAKWKLDDPKVNFAISSKGGTCGMNHLGIQVDSNSELEQIKQRLNNAEINYSEQKGTSCCHSHSNKHWSLDPQGIAWETFHTLNDSPTFDADTESDDATSCCIPLDINQSKEAGQDCCIPNKNDTSGCCQGDHHDESKK